MRARQGRKPRAWRHAHTWLFDNGGPAFRRNSTRHEISPVATTDRIGRSTYRQYGSLRELLVGAPIELAKCVDALWATFLVEEQGARRRSNLESECT